MVESALALGANPVMLNPIVSVKRNCDVVVTEKACHHILRVASLLDRLETTVLDKLKELPRVLAERKPKQRLVHI